MHTKETRRLWSNHEIKPDRMESRNMFCFFTCMVHPPKNSGWLPGAGFANECKAEPLADNHLSSRGVVGFEPAPHIQRIEEKNAVIVPKMLQIRPRNPLKMEAGVTLLHARKGSGVPQKSI